MRSGKFGFSSRAFSAGDVGNRDADMDTASFDASLWAEAEEEVWRTQHRTAEKRESPSGTRKAATPHTSPRLAASRTFPVESTVSLPTSSRSGSKSLAASTLSTSVYEEGVRSRQSSYGRQASRNSILSMTQGELPAFAGTAALYDHTSPSTTPSISRTSPFSRAPRENPWQREKIEEDTATLPQEQRQKPLTVSETLECLRNALEGIIDGLWISGEVATVTRSAAGHLYFSLKDESGLIECVYYRRRASYRDEQKSSEREFQLGERIEVRGRADVYAARGRMQLVITSWQPAGAGSLYEAFLKLRAKLELEGLFLKERKKSLPAFIRRVALVTSSQAAAYRDVMRTIERRTPWVKILFAETLVQGREAPAAIIAALRAADRARCDAILLVRGGGAYEDLQAFNDEEVARTLALLHTPVICGVGHESDVTIADLVADQRASTPTAAAEAIGQDQAYWQKRFDGLEETLEKSMERHLLHAMQRVDFVSAALPNPVRKIERLQNRLTLMKGRFSDPAFVLAAPARRLQQIERQFATPESFIAYPWQRFTLAAERFSAPDALLEIYKRREEDAGKRFCGTAKLCEAQRATRLMPLQERLESAPQHILGTLTQRLQRTRCFLKPPVRTMMSLERRIDLAAAALALADPNRPLRAGYVRVECKGDAVCGVSALAPGEQVTLVFADGRAEATLGRIDRTRAPEATSETSAKSARNPRLCEAGRNGGR